MAHLRIRSTDAPAVVLFRRPSPVPIDTVAAVALVPEAGVWDVTARVWPAGESPTVPHFIYAGNGLAVSWCMVNRVTGQRLDLQPAHIPASATIGG